MAGVGLGIPVGKVEERILNYLLMKLSGYRSFSLALLIVMLVAPLSNLLWHWHIGWIRLNWIAYPFLLLALALSISDARRVPASFLVAMGMGAMYLILFFLKGGAPENLVRLLLALLPLFFVKELRAGIDEISFSKFWKAYPVALLIPLLFCILQVFGLSPYYDSGMAYDLYPGRISGGYMKPNNLNAILFPAFLYGFYLYYKGEKTKGMMLSGVLYLVVLVSGLRTSVMAYTIILLLALVPRISHRLITRAFNYGIFLVIGLSSFFILSFGLETLGILDGFRQRLPMWMVQSQYFFHSSVTEIWLGKGDVLLPEEARKFPIASLTEVHNNDFRLIITFGILGYIVYGLFLRQIANVISASNHSDQLKFLQSACLVHVVVYGITNEPAFYAGVFWPLIAWIFFTTDLPTKGSKD